jgi:hypothetical protein
VKDWAKPLPGHVDPYHLGIRFVGFVTAKFVVKINFTAEIYLLFHRGVLLPEAICQDTGSVVHCGYSEGLQRKGLKGSRSDRECFSIGIIGLESRAADHGGSPSGADPIDRGSDTSPCVPTCLRTDAFCPRARPRAPALNRPRLIERRSPGDLPWIGPAHQLNRPRLGVAP